VDRCALVLDDGSRYEGNAFGAPVLTVDELVVEAPAKAGIGEVVFNTSMTGYHEILTDPSYTGQIVAMTYPLIGNYGCDAAWNESPVHGDAGIGTAGAMGLVVREAHAGPVQAGRDTLDDFLKKHGIPGIAGVDTRRLTLSLRDRGSRNAAIVRSSSNPNDSLDSTELAKTVAYLGSFPAMVGRNLVSEIAGSTAVVVNASGHPHVAVLDCGAKANIVRELVSRGCSVTVLPSTITEAEMQAVGADALLVSNGPGDPAVLHDQVSLVKSALGTMPVLGICLGHQLVAIALGAATYKMSFGHHGANHPVRDESTGKVFVTSQNHGFAVEEASIPTGCDLWFRNANDGTVEGLRNRQMSLLTTQFHPEAAPGPRDAVWIFDEFITTIVSKVDS
jgi:carbamoyl-phosphate synthase small subunit